MKILFFGDVVGEAGRKAIKKNLPVLKKQYAADFVLVNGENAAGGFGITQAICKEMETAGADCITGGDHIWDQKEVHAFIGNYNKLLRPANFPEKTPGFGIRQLTTADGKRVVVLHLLAQLFMKFQLDCPFKTADTLLAAHKLGGTCDAIIVDFHGEATSEKMAMGHYLDGRVSLVVGSHTHVPTADTMILSGGTAYQTDAGMCGDYNSVIGFEKKISLGNFTNKYKTDRLTPAGGEATLCGVFVETDNRTGLATSITPVRYGGKIGIVE